jgi:hypothetical protein
MSRFRRLSFLLQWFAFALLPWMLGAWSCGIVVLLALGASNDLATWAGTGAVPLFGYSLWALDRRTTDDVYEEEQS